MPNVFYRTSRTPLAPSLRSLSGEAAQQRLAELSQPLTPEAMEADAAAYIGFLASQECVRPGSLGVVGFCFSGKMAMHTAAARPEKIAAVASFHGGGLFTAAPTSPHLVASHQSSVLFRPRHATTAACPPHRSPISKTLSTLGASTMKAKSTKARSTAGRGRIVLSTIIRRQNALFRSSLSCSLKH